MSTCFSDCVIFQRGYEYVPERRRHVVEEAMVDNADGLFDHAHLLKSSQLKKR